MDQVLRRITVKTPEHHVEEDLHSVICRIACLQKFQANELWNFSDCRFRSLENDVQINYDLIVTKCVWSNEDCILLAFENTSERKSRLGLLELDRFKDKILASFSHNLRTPLHGMSGMLEIC